jgi:RNA polymerase sigma-70 factor, ECF subfamily
VDLADVFLTAVDAPERFEGVDDLDLQLRRLADTGAAAWPAIALDAVAFVRHVGETFPTSGDAPAVLASLRAPELFLAAACVAGDSGALRAFEQRYLQVAEVALARFADERDFRQEAFQELRIRLFGPGHPRIAEYDGSGSLENWLRVVATRVGLNIVKSNVRHVPVADPVDRSIADSSDPELEILKSRYRSDFTVALREAFEDLPGDTRRILRFYLVDRLNIGEIGAIVGASRATIGRRVVECRRILLDSTRQRLRDRLGGATSAELDSVVRLINSRFDLTLSRVLAE